jgi:cholera toxin transcriptional activator
MYVLDDTRGFIHSLKSQVRHSIGSNEVSLLSYMLTNKGKVLSKHELMNEVWLKRGVVVETSSLMQSISRCRRGFEDKAGELIRTERGVGYEFTGSVERIDNLEQVLPPVAQIGECKPSDIDCSEDSQKRDAKMNWKSGTLLSCVILSVLAAGFFSNQQGYNVGVHSDYTLTKYEQCSYIPSGSHEVQLYAQPKVYKFDQISLLVDHQGRSFSFNNESQAVKCE